MIRLPNPGERNALRRIKSDAAAARREFTISLEWFIKACHEPCHYCGRVDQNTLSVRSTSKTTKWIVKDFKYNGLDRVDNSLGYTEQNCVPCCAVCNRAKNSMSYNEYMEYIDTLIKFRGELNNERKIRDIQFPVERGKRPSRDEVETTFKQGGYVPSNGAYKRPDYSGCVIPEQRSQGEDEKYSLNSEKEESV